MGNGFRSRAYSLPLCDTGATGYGCGKPEPIGSHPDAPTLKPSESLERSPAVCYACCAKHDHEQASETGRATLYLSGTSGRYKISNWPGSLEYQVMSVRKGRHNIARTRYDVRFNGPDESGALVADWYGVQYGENTQILHCRRLGATRARKG